MLLCLIATCSRPHKRPPGKIGPALRITGVEVKPLDRKEEGSFTQSFHSDTLRGQITFELHARSKRVLIEYDSTLVAYDELRLEHNRNLKPGDEPIPYPPSQNHVEYGSGVLAFNKPVLLDGVALSPGTNVLAADYSGEAVLYASPSVGARSQVHVREERLRIPKGWNELYFRWSTDDGLVLGDTVRVYIDR